MAVQFEIGQKSNPVRRGDSAAFEHGASPDVDANAALRERTALKRDSFE
jgi:hypothetical protein